MRICLLEDDRLHATATTDELRRGHSSIQVDVIATELEFRRRFGEIAASSPDAFIIDMMVPWTTPTADQRDWKPPSDLAGGMYRAGLRCVDLIEKNTRTRGRPIVVWSVLSRDDLGSVANQLPTNVLFRSKSTRTKDIFRLIRNMMPVLPPQLKQQVFVVHGRNHDFRETVARFLEGLGVQPVILDEQVNLGQSILDKLDQHADVDAAIVLLTADEVGGLRDRPQEERRKRSRQNVVMELGYFLARLGKDRVITVCEHDVEIPSDYSGIASIPIDTSGVWKLALEKELRGIGLMVTHDPIL